MNRKLIIGGCVGVVVLLLLAMFPTVVGSQTKQLKYNNNSFFQQIFSDNINIDSDDFRDLLSFLFGFILYIIVLIYELIFGW